MKLSEGATIYFVERSIVHELFRDEIEIRNPLHICQHTISPQLSSELFDSQRHELKDGLKLLLLNSR